MSDKLYETFEVGQMRTKRVVIKAGSWHQLDKKSAEGKDVYAHFPAACEVTEHEQFVFEAGKGRWKHHHYVFDAAPLPTPDPVPTPLGFWARLWARMRGRKIPEARLLRVPRPPEPDSGGW